MTQLFNPDPAWMPHQVHAQTSVDAGHSMKSSAGSQREKIFTKILSHGQAGLTDQEISQVTGIDLNSVRPRRLELQHENRIVPAGTRATASGRQAQVWIINYAKS